MKNFRIGVTLFIIIMTMFFTEQLFPAFEVGLLGGKTTGVGNALIADNDGCESGFQNPAMLTYIHTFVGMAAYSPMLVGIDESSINLFSGGVAYKYKNLGTLGLHYSGLNVSSFNENIYNESIIKILYGKGITENFSAGLVVSLLNWSASFSMFDNVSSEAAKSSLIIDVGIGIVFSVDRNIRIGLVADNLNSPSVSSGDKLPLDLKLGLVYGNSDKKDWSLYFNMDTEFNNLNYNLGAELNKILNLFSIRSGIEFIDSGNGINFTLGAGYKYTALNYDIVIDYGFAYPILNLSDTLGTHVVSVGIKY